MPSGPRTAFDRRAFLTTTGLGALLAGGVPIGLTAQAGDSSAAERANVQVVNDLIAAFVARDAARVAAQFTDDAVFRAGRIGKLSPPRKPQEFFKELVEGASSIEMKVVSTFPIGPIVVHDRHDRILSPTRKIIGRWAGIFAVTDGRIAEFTDYTLDNLDW